MKKKYKVVGPHSIAGHPPGDSFEAEELAHEQALVDGGHLEVKVVEKLACPACVEQGMKRPPKFDSYEELPEHYAEKHAGLVPPIAGEEE